MPPPTHDREPSLGERLRALPVLGLGVSTEFGAGRHGLDPLALHRRLPDLVRFLEIGCDLERGVDADARAWVEAGLPTTYHFLDANLEEPEDLDDAWLVATARLAREVRAAWICGDAGLWHVGPRERGHGTLMPPVLEPSSAREMADAVRRLRAATGFEVLPENPPAHVYVGRMHLAEYYAEVAERADAPLLCDVAHLAIHQIATRRGALDGLDAYPFERVVEMHVAAGTTFEVEGRQLVADDHGLDVLPETWEILEHALPRARELRAVVLECERNRIDEVVPLYERLAGLTAGALAARAEPR